MEATQAHPRIFARLESIGATGVRFQSSVHHKSVGFRATWEEKRSKADLRPYPEL